MVSKVTLTKDKNLDFAILNQGLMKRKIIGYGQLPQE